MARRLLPNSDSWGGAWGIIWAGSWGWSWGPLHEVEDESVIGGGGSHPFTWRIPKTKDEEPRVEYPKYHPWIHAPEDIKRELEREIDEIGKVEPEVVDAVIQSVSRTVEKRTVRTEQDQSEIARKELMDFLDSRKMEWIAGYENLIRLEYARQEQEYEDAQIAMLLFEM